MKLDQPLPEERLQQAIRNSAYFQQLEKTRIKLKKSGVPRWELSNQIHPTQVGVHTAIGNKIPDSILSQNILLEDGYLYRFDVVHHPTFTTIIFSWHHILLDAFGAGNVLASLNYDAEIDASNFLGKDVKENKRTQWKNLVEAKDFLKEIAQKPILEILPREGNNKVGYLAHRFTTDETAYIQKQVKKYSRGGIETPYLLGHVAMAYHKLLTQKGMGQKDIWVPVPIETRKTGAQGPIIGNWHSLLFFRIKCKLLTDKAAVVKDLNAQFFEQVKRKMPQKYASMLRMLRVLPISFYYRLVKRPNGSAISGMLYSQSPPNKGLQHFLGCKVLDTTPLPPNTSPPGISFQITTFENRLKLIAQYNHNYFSTQEIEGLMKEMVQQLIGDYA